MNLLLLRPDRAGDAIKTLPVLRAAVLRLPGSRISLLASAHNRSLFEYEPGIELFSLPPGWETASDLKSVATQAVRGQSFDSAVSLLCDSFPEIDRLAAALDATRKFQVRRDLPAFSPVGRDETQNIAILLTAAIGVDLTDASRQADAAPCFSDSDHQESHERLVAPTEKRGKWLAYCPFASTINRKGSVAGGRHFLNHALSRKGIERIFVFAAPSEREAATAMIDKRHRGRISLCTPSSFRSVGAHFLNLDGVVAVDSGPLHLARALSIAHLGILSGADFERWYGGSAPRSVMIKRGILSRFPNRYEVARAFDRWLKLL